MKAKKKMAKGGKVKEFLKKLNHMSSKKIEETPSITGPKKKKVPSILGPSYKKGGKVRMYKKGGGMSNLNAAQKQVYKRGLAAYMSSGNRPKTSQHAWAMARVKSAFGKREAAKIASGKGKNSKKK